MPEKEYVLGNKTKDLLAYSFVVTKPIGDKTLEISEVIKMLGAIKSLPPEARDDILAQYLDRFEKANSPAEIPEERPAHLHQNGPGDCCVHRQERPRRKRLLLPDGVRPAAGPHPRRPERLQSAPEAGGDQPSPRIYQREENGSLDKLITDVKYMTLAWKKKDTERAKTLRRQEEARDYELQASIIAGAVARALGRR